MNTDKADLLTRLRQVEPDAPGERTRWHRNPDGPEAADEIERLRQFGRLTRGERLALEFAIGVYPLDDSIPDTLRGLLKRLG